MYLEHFGLNEAPFRITPHTDFFFSGAKRGATLEALLYAIIHDEGIVKISGEVGSGKTMLCRVLMERLPEQVAIIYLANPSLSREDILYALADELGIKLADNSRPSSVMRALQETLVERYATGQQVVVLIDEAHAMPMETLEEIRLLSNLESNRHKLLQLVLFGQPELDVTLARADMRQLRERITHNFTLEPLPREDVAAYLDFRLRAAGYRGPPLFAAAAVKLISQASQGLSRRINILADKALLAAFADGAHQVGTREARAAIRDADFGPAQGGLQHPRTRLAQRLLWASAGSLLLLLVFAAGYFLAQPPVSVPSIPAAPATQQAPSPLPPPPDTAPVNPPATSSATPPTLLFPPQFAQLLEDSHPWITTVAPNRWFLQIYTTPNTDYPERVEAFLTAARAAGVDMAQLRVYHSEIGNNGRFGVIYGDYASHSSALEALKNLPPILKRYRPYVRQTIKLHPAGNSDAKN
jgi:type II secretory pathway predicted ATPase ExeA